MTKFALWCTSTTEPVGSHELTVMIADPSKTKLAVKVISAAIPLEYTSEARLANLLKNLGKAKTAKFIETSLPTTKSVRSGDLGEILGVAYLNEFTKFNLQVKRLRWKDHRNMAMRGEDILAFAVAPGTGKLSILKGEAKSRNALNTATVKAARKSLAANKGRPSAHALSFLATRYFEMGDAIMTNLLDRAQLNERVEPSQVTHLIFTLSANNPTMMLRTDLANYNGSIDQLSVGLRVEKHQEFIKSVFEKANVNVL
ncbi:MAG: Hachiman antiphage defense system protein HamA [Candidatus Nitrotoga sp.]